MTWILVYLIIGLILAAIADNGYYKETKENLPISTLILGICLWPFAILDILLNRNNSRRS